MKKVFSIVLALAMVLSMGAAMAATCNFSWTSSPAVCKTGVPTLEVVEFVRQTTACGVELVENSCAVAMENERAYYAIKLVVPTDIDKNWWTLATTAAADDTKDAGLKIAYTNLFKDADNDTLYDAGEELTKEYFDLPLWDDVKAGGTFWLLNTADGAADATGLILNGKTTDVWTDTFSASKVVFTDKWVSRNCAKIEASVAVASKIAADDTNVFSKLGYDIVYDATPGAKKLTFTNANGDAVVFTLASDDTIASAEVTMVGGAAVTLVGYAGDKASYKDNSVPSKVYGTACAEGKFLYDVFTKFGLGFDSQKVTDDNIKANFGYKLTIKDTSTYSAQGTAIVDVNCEISIPKTGDVSVIAYAVMALVTAAGAVSLKK